MALTQEQRDAAAQALIGYITAPYPDPEWSTEGSIEVTGPDGEKLNLPRAAFEPPTLSRPCNISSDELNAALAAAAELVESWEPIAAGLLGETTTAGDRAALLVFVARQYATEL